MRNRGGQQLAAVVVWLVGVCLLVLPESVTTRLRSLPWDLARPGEQLVELSLRAGSEFLHPQTPAPLTPETHARITQLENRLRELELQNHRLKVQQDLIPPRIRASSDGTAPLIIPDLLTARVIGQELSRIWHEQPVLNQGSTTGARADLLVLDKERVNLDVGRDLGIRPDSPVYSGRMVIGRIARVGLFTSSVRLITDAQYRGEARIYRTPARNEKSPPLSVPTPGILAGDGKTACRLLDIPPAAPVEVGDWVYTAEEDGILPHAMCYGRVSRAELKPGAIHWEIDVRPAADLAHLGEVHLLRTRLNPTRFDPHTLPSDTARPPSVAAQ